jgi:hypothetical protein
MHTQCGSLSSMTRSFDGSLEKNLSLGCRLHASFSRRGWAPGLS